MDILVITREYPPYVLGGLSYHLLHLYNKMANLGHNITVITGKCPQSRSELSSRVNQEIKTHTVEFGYKDGYHLLFPLALKKKLVRFDTSKYDVIFTHTQIPFDFDSYTVAKYHDCMRETRHIHRGNMNKMKKLGDTLVDPIRKGIDQRAINHSDLNLFISKLMKNSWERHYSLPSAKKVLYNGVDTNLFYPRDTNKGDYILFVGDSPRKGIDRVLDFARKSNENVCIVGGDKSWEENNLRVLPRVSPDQLAEIYTRAKVTVHPARYEPFGNTILESLACGTPVVSSSSCGASEILTPSTGLISINLHEAIERATQFGRDDCVNHATKYSWENVAEMTIKLVDRRV